MLLSVTEFIGRFHPVLVHLPIGILLMALLLLWLSRKEKYHISPELIKVVLLCGLFSAILSCITGYMLSLNGDYDGTTVVLHMWMGIGVTAAALLLCAKVFSRQFDAVYKIAAIGLLVLILVTGHLGGSLTHGENYLTAAITGIAEDADLPPKVIPNIQEANAYTDVVQPLLQSKCYSCHGPHKQKGGLRMDDIQRLLKGGKDGVVLVPGNCEESEMIKRLLLPKEHEDHMPPKQKSQLNEKQIALLSWWVNEGADFTKKVKDLPQPDSVKPVLLSFQSDHIEHKAPATVPEAPVEKGDEKAVQALKDRGIVVIPVAQNSNYLSANFVTATTVADADLKLLLPLKKQLIWLKLNDTKISDKGVAALSQCSNLTQLYLNNTAITDKGIDTLKSLSQLQILSLVGTGVTVNGLTALQPLKKLHSLYLYQTKVGREDWPLLKKVFPKTALDSGGYSIPFLTTDTAVVKANGKY